MVSLERSKPRPEGVEAVRSKHRGKTTIHPKQRPAIVTQNEKHKSSTQSSIRGTQTNIVKV